LDNVGIQLSEKTSSPSPSSSIRLRNSGHPAVDRGAPRAIARMFAAPGTEIGLLESRRDGARAARANGAPIDFDDRRQLHTGAAEADFVALVDLGPAEPR